MSRDFKDKQLAQITALGAGAVTNPEGLSGADLEQIKLAARNGVAATGNGATGAKSLGTNPRFPGTPSNAALTGADLEKAATK